MQILFHGFHSSSSVFFGGTSLRNTAEPLFTGLLVMKCENEHDETLSPGKILLGELVLHVLWKQFCFLSAAAGVSLGDRPTRQTETDSFRLGGERGVNERGQLAKPSHLSFFLWHVGQHTY